MSAMNPAQLTGHVLDTYGKTPDPRLREILTSLISHLHAFATETRLTPQEWLAGLEFLTATGQKCDSERQEFILLSDVLGLSSLVDLLNAADGATESTVLGPFYVPGAPRRAMGDQIGRPEDGEPALVRGHVTDPAGQPLDGATLDVWQSSANGFYDTQDPGQPPFNLRGVFVTGADGRYEFRTARPSATRSPPTGRSATCCAAPGGIAGGPPTSTPSSRPRGGGPSPRISSMPRTPTWTLTRSSGSRTRWSSPSGRLGPATRRMSAGWSTWISC
jgi:hypothetical protein